MVFDCLTVGVAVVAGRRVVLLMGGVEIAVGAGLITAALGLHRRWTDGRVRLRADLADLDAVTASTERASDRGTEPQEGGPHAGVADGHPAAGPGTPTIAAPTDGASTEPAGPTPTVPSPDDPAPPGAVVLDAAPPLPGERGSVATLVQFSSTFCQPCRATRLVLAEVAGRVEGVVHLDLDVADHLDLVRHHGIRRTPTVLILDAAGREVGRAAGVPRRAAVEQVLTALGGQVANPAAT